MNRWFAVVWSWNCPFGKCFKGNKKGYLYSAYYVTSVERALRPLPQLFVANMQLRSRSCADTWCFRFVFKCVLRALRTLNIYAPYYSSTQNLQQQIYMHLMPSTPRDYNPPPPTVFRPPYIRPSIWKTVNDLVELSFTTTLARLVEYCSKACAIKSNTRCWLSMNEWTRTKHGRTTTFWLLRVSHNRQICPLQLPEFHQGTLLRVLCLGQNIKLVSLSTPTNSPYKKLVCSDKIESFLGADLITRIFTYAISCKRNRSAWQRPTYMLPVFSPFLLALLCWKPGVGLLFNHRLPNYSSLPPACLCLGRIFSSSIPLFVGSR